MRKLSVDINGHRTSVFLEEAFWEQLEALAQARGISVGEVVADLDRSRNGVALSFALRAYILTELMKQRARS